MHQGFWLGILKQKYLLGDLGVNGRITLIMVLKEKGRRGLDSRGSGQKQVGECYKHGNEPLGSIICRVFLD